MFDAFLVFSLILCVATGNAVYALVLLAISAVLELIDIGKQIYKTVRKEDDSNFKIACEKAGVSQASQISRMMQQFIDSVSDSDTEKQQ